MPSISKQSKLKIDRIMAIVALVTIVVAWIFGASKDVTEIRPFLQKTLPEADRIESLSDGTYAAYDTDSNQKKVGYLAVGEANGYGGNLKISVAVDTSGKILNYSIIEQKETYVFLRRVLKSDLMPSLINKLFSEPFVLGQDINNVTGATYTCRGLVEAVRDASREVAQKNLGYPVPPIQSPQIIFGLAEIVLILLFIIGIVAHFKWFRYRKYARWFSMIVGIIVFGFIYNSPLTMNLINKLLLGFWPVWQTNLFWYLLLGGIVFLILINNRNPYCEWFCPFGAMQECFGVIGGAKVRTPSRMQYLLKWIQRGLAWLAIILALIFQNPSISSYEVFSTLFKLIGSNIQFILLGIVLVFSLFLKRPWCSFLCPLRPVTDFIKLIKNWIRDLWKKTKPKPIA